MMLRISFTFFSFCFFLDLSVSFHQRESSSLSVFHLFRIKSFNSFLCCKFSPLGSVLLPRKGLNSCFLFTSFIFPNTCFCFFLSELFFIVIILNTEFRRTALEFAVIKSVVGHLVFYLKLKSVCE